jgi:hypothetical protein
MGYYYHILDCIFLKKFSFVTEKSDQDPDPDPHEFVLFGSLDLDPDSNPH